MGRKREKSPFLHPENEVAQCLAGAVASTRLQQSSFEGGVDLVPLMLPKMLGSGHLV